MASPRHRVANGLLLVANLAVANGAAAFVVLGFVRPTFVGVDLGPAQAVFGGRVFVAPLDTGLAWGLFVGAIALLLWNFAWLARRTERMPPGNWVLSDTPSGPVRVAREALETGLRLAGEALPEVTRLRVQVDTSAPKKIVVTGQFQCAEGASNLFASQRLRQVLVDRFGEMVRPADGSRVEFDLEFQGFAGKAGKKGVEMQPPHEAPPFTGPQYPIDDEQQPGGLP